MKSDYKAINASLRLGWLYDSRVGSASGGGDADSDTGFAATIAAGWQAPIEGDFGLRFDYSGYADFHQDFDEYDILDNSFSVEPQYTIGQTTLSLPLTFNYAMEDNDTDYTRIAGSPTLTYLIPNTDQAIALYGIVGVIDDRDEDKTLDEDGDSIGAGCAYLMFFENKSRIRLSLDYQHTEYDALVAEYNTVSISSDEREDDIIVAGLDIQYQIHSNFGIYVNYSFIHSNANVDIYDYDRSVVETGIVIRY